MSETAIQTIPTELAEGYRQTELGLLPGEWEVVRLGDVAIKTFGGGTPSTKRADFWNGPIPWTTTAVIGEQDTLLKSFQRGITEEGLQNSSTQIAPANSVLIGTRVGVGKAVVAPFEVAVNQDITVFIPDADLLSEFLALLMKAPSVQRWFSDNKRGTTIKGVPRKDVLDLKVPLPPLPEQRSIAHVLHTVQKAKETTEQVIASTRELKRSLMNHLFTYGPVPVEEADQVPLKETEVGPLPEHWEVVNLGRISDVKGGKRLPKGHKFADYVTEHPYIRVVDFENSSININNLQYLLPEDYEAIKRYVISSEDVYISIAGTIGVVGTVPQELDGANLTENAAKIVVKDKQNLDKIFLMYFLYAERGQGQISTLTTKTSQPKLALSRIKQILVPIPHLSDQQEVAHAFSTVDLKLKMEQNRKHTLDVLFKTLLHNLMTGKVRVHDLDLTIVGETI